ncbi:MAG: phage recombination protein Bet [Clostridia bacterium]|nr:phage recombination protein Bet [Clostridia bacterium]
MSEKKELVVSFEVDGSTVKLTPSIVQNYIVGSDSTITMQEFKFFTELCKARKLNPFLKEAYCIKYGNQPAQMVVSKDVFMKRAVLNKSYDGMESGIIVIGKNNEVIERKGTFKLPDEILVGGWAKVYRKDWKYPTYCSVSFEEVAQKKKDGSLNSNWAGKGATMVEKVAKVRALRETFIEQFSGMYEADELGQDVKEPENIVEQNEPISDEIIDIDAVPEQVSFDEL